MKARLNTQSIATLFIALFILLGSSAFASGTKEGNKTLKTELKRTLNTDVLKENGLDAAKVLVIFKVENDSSIQIVNAASMEAPIKEYVTKVLNGQVTSDLIPGEEYQITISFKRY